MSHEDELTPIEPELDEAVGEPQAIASGDVRPATLAPHTESAAMGDNSMIPAGLPIGDLLPGLDEGTLRVQVAGITIPGRRISNEDSIHYEARDARPGFVRGAIAVADGGSDMSTGGLASKLAIGKFRAGAEHASRDADIEPSRLLVHACHRAHENIRDAIDERRTMGRPFASFVGAYVVDNGFVLGHVGKTSAFLVRCDGAVELTPPVDGPQDGDCSAQAWDKRSEARPTACLGSATKPPISLYPGSERYYRASDGQVLVLCSDGLAGVLDAGKIREVLTRTQSIEEACELLASLALVKGSGDNVSIVCAEFGHLPRRSRTERAPVRAAFRPVHSAVSSGLSAKGIAVAAALALAVVLGGSAVKHAQQARALTPLHASYEIASPHDRVEQPIPTAEEALAAHSDVTVAISGIEPDTRDRALEAITGMQDVAPGPLVAIAPEGEVQTDEPLGENSVAGVDGPDTGPVPLAAPIEQSAPAPRAPTRGTIAPRTTRPAPARQTPAPRPQTAPRPAEPTASATRVTKQETLPALPRSGQPMRLAPTSTATD